MCYGRFLENKTPCRNGVNISARVPKPYYHTLQGVVVVQPRIRMFARKNDFAER